MLGGVLLAMRLNADLAKALDPLGFQSKFIEAGIRADGRDSWIACRPIHVKSGVLSSGSLLSSASCSIGKTAVIVSITAGVFSLPSGIVKPDHAGKILVSSDLSLCIAERRVSQSKGGCLSDRIQSVLTQLIDTKQLEVDVIKADLIASLVRSKETPHVQHVWDIAVNILVVNDDGSVFDAALMGAVKAVQAVKLPALNEKLRIVNDREPRTLTLGQIPCPLSVCQYGNKGWLCDPTLDEQSILASYSVVMSESGDIVFLSGPDVPEGVTNASSTKTFTNIVDELVPLALSQYSIRSSMMILS